MSTKFLSPGWRMPRNANQSKSSNYSIDFNSASSDYIDVGQPSGLGYGTATTNFSVSVWVKTDDWNSKYIFGNRGSGTGTNDSGFAFSTISQYPDYNGLLFRVGNNTHISAAFNYNELQTNTWTHFVIVYDGSGSTNSDKVKIYKDSTPLSLTFNLGNIPATVTSTLDFAIGAYTWATGRNGQMDGQINEVSIFDYALSPSQVTTLWGGGTSVSNPMALPSPPVAYYPLGGSAAAFRTPVNTGDQWLIENNAIGDYVFDFDGSEESVDINNDFNNYTEMSVSTWVNFNNFSGYQYVFSTAAPNNGAGTQFSIAKWENTGEIYSYDGANLNATGVSVILNTWNHILVTQTGTTRKVFINGQQAGNDITTSALNLNQGTAFIGKYHTSGYSANAKISNVQIFNTALSATEAETLYNYGSPIRTLANIPQSSNLKAWYKLDSSEVYNNTTTEWSIDNNQNPSAYASSLEFDSASSDYIDYGNPSIFDDLTSFSFSCWFNSDVKGNDDGILGKWLSGTNRSFALNLETSGASSNIRFIVKNTTGGTAQAYISGSDWSTGNWYNVSGTYDGNNIKLYLNGDLKDTVALTGTVINATQSFRIGVYGSSSHFDGKLSNVSFWNTGLTSTQVTELYNNGTPSNLSSHSATSNLVSWWKLNNTTTGIEDAKGSNNGTNNGATEYTGFVNKLVGESSGMSQANLVQSDLQTVAPYSKYAMDFDASSGDYIDCGNDSSFDITSALTLSAWVKLSSVTTDQFYISKRGGSSANAYQISSFSNKAAGMSIWIGGSRKDLLGTTNHAQDTWYHVVGTYDGLNMRIYLNGVEENSVAQTGVIDTTTTKLILGAYDGVGYSFDGSISNCSIWNTALTSSQVTEIYNQGLPSNLNSHSAYSNLVSWWQLGENSSFDGNDWIVADEKGTNNGTSVSMPVGALVNGVGTTANGVSSGMSEGNLVGDAPYSTANALSTNMVITSRVTGSGNTP